MLKAVFCSIYREIILKVLLWNICKIIIACQNDLKTCMNRSDIMKFCLVKKKKLKRVSINGANTNPTSESMQMWMIFPICWRSSITHHHYTKVQTVHLHYYPFVYFKKIIHIFSHPILVNPLKKKTPRK